MQLSRACVGAAAILILAATPEASPSSLAWKPNEFADVQDLLADDATENLASAVTAEHQAALKPQEAKSQRDPAVVKLAKHGVQSQNKFANPLLDSYLGDSDASPRASGGEFTTHWNVKAKSKDDAQPATVSHQGEIPDEANAYIRDLHGEDPQPPSLKDKFAARRAAAPNVAAPPTMPLSKVLGSDMKDAVVTAEMWDREDRGGKQTTALAAATRWGSAHLRGPDASLAAGRVAVKSGASAGASDSNPYMTLLGGAQTLDLTGAASTSNAKNPYFAYFRSDKEKVQDDATAAEKQATNVLETHQGHNSYLNSIVPDSVFIAVSGR